MADELDRALRDAFERAAQPGDPSGVADAIRTRVAAGDPGAPVAGSTAPGWGGGLAGMLPWVGLVLLAGGAGAVLGATGVLGAPEERIDSGYTVVLDDAVPALACPGGPVVGALSAGDRVLAVVRSEDSGYLGVRDPSDVARTLWVERSIVVVDEGQPDVDSLPVDACPVAVVETAVPDVSETPAPPEDPDPEPAPGPAPDPGPSDTTAPTIGQWFATPTLFIQGETTTVHAVASDDVAVTSIAISWSGAQSGSGLMTKGAGSSWLFTLDPNDDDFGDITFTLVAVDAAGNESSPVTVTVDYQYLG